MRKPFVSIFLALFALAQSHQLATAEPAQARPWSPSSKWSLAVDGKISLDAQFFVERGKRRIMVMSPDVSGIALVNRVGQNVTAIDVDAVILSDDGESAILATDATVGKTTSPYTFDTNQKPPIVNFSLGDTRLKITPKFPLVGLTTPADILRHSPSFKKHIETYTPTMIDVETIKNANDVVEIEVFFGTWCSHCKVLIPQFMKTIEMAANPNIRVVYVAVPRRLSSYLPAKQKGVRLVPSFIFYQNRKEFHRISGDGEGTIEHHVAEVLFPSDP